MPMNCTTIISFVLLFFFAGNINGLWLVRCLAENKNWMDPAGIEDEL